MKKFTFGDRTLFLPDDAVLEWSLKHQGFVPMERMSSSGLVCSRDWNVRGSYVHYFKAGVWVSHANLRETMETRFIVAFESENTLDFTDESELARGKHLEVIVEEAICQGFQNRRLSRGDLLEGISSLAKGIVDKGWCVGLEASGEYMTSFD